MTSRSKSKLTRRAPGPLSSTRRVFLKKLWGSLFVVSSVLANIKTLTGWPTWGSAVPPAPAPRDFPITPGTGSLTLAGRPPIIGPS